MANALNFTETISLKDRSSLRHCERPACYNSPTVNRAVVIRATKSARATFSHVLSFEPSRLAVIKLTPKHHGHLNCLIFADTTHPYLSMPANARTQKIQIDLTVIKICFFSSEVEMDRIAFVLRALFGFLKQIIRAPGTDFSYRK